MPLANQHILLGITGGIAAYKTPELVRQLIKLGAEVEVVLSQGALDFVAPLSLQAVSGRPVWQACDQGPSGMAHIELARWADRVLIAPLTANRLAALAGGMADDLLSTICLATRAPIILCPAMNTYMWTHQATQRQARQCEAYGYTLWGPDEGEQACGDLGPGRMLEPNDIVSRLSDREGPLSGKHLLITAGPTCEPIDPVRYIGNRSSGKMGFALARAAQSMGAKVTLVSGPVALSTPRGVRGLAVKTAAEMLDAVMSELRGVDIFISAAAVADYTCKEVATQKIKKTDSVMQLSLSRTTDILATVAAEENRPFCVGFAAESHEGEAYARQKLQDKRLDLVAYNDITQPGLGFESDENALIVFSGKDRWDLPRASKDHLAKQLMELIHAHTQR